MSLNRNYTFWGSLSPLGGLTSAGLLIMASARLSWAITVAGSLFWVYGFTAFSFSLLSSTCSKFFPVSGRKALYTCFASFWGSIYLLLFWMISPFAAMEVFLLLLLVPLFCASSGIVEHLSAPVSENYSMEILDYVSDALSRAAALSGLLIVFSIIREPFSYCSLTFPGTFQGMVTIMYFKAGSFFPLGIFATSAGALLVLGYFICLYQYCRSVIYPGESV